MDFEEIALPKKPQAWTTEAWDCSILKVCCSAVNLQQQEWDEKAVNPQKSILPNILFRYDNEG